MEKRTVIDQIEVLRNRNIRVRLDKQIVVDGAVVTPPAYHRLGELPAGTSDDMVNAHIAAASAQLQTLGYPLDETAAEMLRTSIRAHWTDEDRAAWKEKRAADMAARAPAKPAA